MPLRQPLVDRRRKEKSRLPVDRAELLNGAPWEKGRMNAPILANSLRVR